MRREKAEHQTAENLATAYKAMVEVAILKLEL